MKTISKTFIYILLLVLIYFIYINPLLSLNTIGLLNSTKKSHHFDVVVSHYKEDLSWLDHYLPDNCRLFIYSKSNEKPNCKKKYIHKILKNVGRCDHTYLSHIILNYDKKLSKNTLFLPGSCDIWYKKLTLNLLLNNIGKYKFNSPTLTSSKFWIGAMDLLLKYSINNGYCSAHKNNRHKNCKLKKYKFDTIDEWEKYFNLKITKLCFWGLMLIRTEIIYSRPKDFYINLRNHLNYADNSINGHFMERSWYTVFMEK